MPKPCLPSEEAGATRHFRNVCFASVGFSGIESSVSLRNSLLLLLTLCLLAGCQKKKTEGPLRIGMDMSYPPFEMRDEQGRPAGVSVDLAQALGEHLGRGVILENMPFTGLIPALQTGRLDAIISSMTATEERRGNVEFSEPYVRTGLCLLASAKSDLQSAADIDHPGRTIAVVRGTTGHIWAGGNLKSATVLVLEKETACVLEVTQGKADAFIYDQMSILRNWQANPGTTRALLKPFKEEEWAVALRKGDSELLGKVNAFLVSFRAGGGFERLGQKWLRDQRAAFTRLGVPFVF